MKILRTAERVSHQDLSDNFVYQRSMLAYVEAANIVNGDVLEIGTGSGYGIDIISANCNKFVTIDKFKNEELQNRADLPKNIEFLQMNIPPFTGIADNSFDYVITFQVIEHIEDDNAFVSEIHRVLKPGGKLVVTTPNKPLSITRNPWHVREYTPTQLDILLKKKFKAVVTNGVTGNDKIFDYYNKNKESVRKITRFDIFNLQYRLPRSILEIPYDIMNRLNRKKLLKANTGLVSDIKMDDYTVAPVDGKCFDLFYIAEK